MVGIIGAVLLAATAPVKVAVPGLSVDGFTAAQSDAWVDRFVTLLSRDDAFKLTTSRDIAAVLGVERQRQLLGCTESGSSCLAELAGALGVDAILTGTIARSGASVTATLRVLKTNDGSQVAAVTGRVKDVDELQDWLDAQAPELARQLRRAFGLPETSAAVTATSGPTTATASSGSGMRKLRWVPVILGGVLGIGGAVFFVVSKDSANKLRTMTFTRDDLAATANTGRTFEGLGLGMLIAGGVALVAGVLWVLLGGST